MELNPVLEIDRLCFEYARRPLFHQLSLQLGEGITWLRGENGAGKTTLLKLLAGALPAHAGTIHLRAGERVDCRLQPLAYRLQAFYCGGDTPQLPWLSLRDMLDLHLALYPSADAALLNAELEAFSLPASLDQPVSTLSLGQHKKMQLALALALPVRLLLIDEPFNGLDVDAVAYLRQRIAEPARLARQCIVLTSHIDPQLPLRHTVQL